MKVPVKMTLKNCAGLQNWKNNVRFPNLCKKSWKIVERGGMSMKKSKIPPLTLISTGLFRQACVFSLKLSEKNGNGNLKLGQILVSTVF